MLCAAAEIAAEEAARAQVQGPGESSGVAVTALIAVIAPEADSLAPDHAIPPVPPAPTSLVPASPSIEELFSEAPLADAGEVFSPVPRAV